MLFQKILRHAVHKGTLSVITQKGAIYVFGNGGPPRATLRLHRRYLEWSLAFAPERRVPEAYMNGTLTIEEGTLHDFIHLALLNTHRLGTWKPYQWLHNARALLKRLHWPRSLTKARANVAYHYDLSPKLYDLFLDQDRQYSCGYFTDRTVGLEQAQWDKKRHIAAKLNLNRPGLKVLDIGAGWGGLGLYLAREENCAVTGLTLSVEQASYSRRRAEMLGLGKACTFKLEDYSQEKGLYDRIVSVGMFEHVGKENYAAFFDKINQLLDQKGVCLLHTIGSFKDGFRVNPFIRKHIFPGSAIPSLSEIMRAVEDADLKVADVEVLRLHYAETLKLWNQRFQTNRKAAAQIYGEAFCRKWEFYLIACETSFRLGQMCVFQIQLVKDITALPLTRSYMMEDERDEPDFAALHDAATAYITQSQGA